MKSQGILEVGDVLNTEDMATCRGRRRPLEGEILRIYVGNLPYSTHEDELAEIFGAHGEVESATVITDRYSGRSKGFGFVEMPTETEAKVAIEALNGKEFSGRTLTVNEARPREERSFGGGGGGGRGSRW